MDLTEFVDRVRQELAVAAEAGGPEAVALAERLTAPLASSFQLVLLDALSRAADEITRDLAPGSVEVRLRGGEPGFAVNRPATDPALRPVAPSMAPSDATLASPEDDEESSEGAAARINFRLPESLKARIEDAAGAEGRSVNAWLTRAASAALRGPGPTGPGGTGATTTAGRSPQHVTGWVR